MWVTRISILEQLKAKDDTRDDALQFSTENTEQTPLLYKNEKGFL